MDHDLRSKTTALLIIRDSDSFMIGGHYGWRFDAGHTRGTSHARLDLWIAIEDRIVGACSFKASSNFYELSPLGRRS